MTASAIPEGYFSEETLSHLKPQVESSGQVLDLFITRYNEE